MTTKNPTRGTSVRVNEHSAFALELASYLNEVRGSMSGREFSRQVASGGHDHWAKILAGAKVMTANDIKVAAEVFGMNPYDFVEQARRHAGHNVARFPNVVPHAEDVERSEFPKGGRMAAETVRPPDE